MANLTLRGEKREGDFRLSSKAGIPVVEETYSYIVESDDEYVDRDEVSRFEELPRVNVTRATSGITICKTKRSERRPGNTKFWDVTCEFSSEVDERSEEQDPETDPNEWIVVYETKFERLQEVVTKDINGTPICNSAGQPFQSGLTLSRFIPCWEFYQFEPATVTDEQIIARNETINEAEFKGRAAETLLLTIMSSVIGYYYGQRRRLTQYSLKYNKRGWQHKRLDAGTQYLNPSAPPRYKPYLDDEGNLMVGPLNGSGAIANTPAILEFDVFEQLDFSEFLRV